jgi:uncharacterized repeat protein (TIGR04052 family)
MRALPLALFLAACGGGSQRYTIDFAATVGGRPFACDQTYAGIGTSGAVIVPEDLRFYVHGVALHHGDQRQALTLDDDDVWQHDGIALLDFEDGTAGCDTSSPQMHTQLTGTAPADEYDAIEFTIGVPMNDDALGVVAAPPPLDVPAMFWSWMGSYKFMKIEVGSTVNPAWYFHLGADDCSAVSLSTLTCKYPNAPTVTLSGWSTTATVNLDLARLYASSDLDARIDGTKDTIPGCMSTAGDPECPSLFGAVGLSFETSTPPPAQTLFEVQ